MELIEAQNTFRRHLVLLWEEAEILGFAVTIGEVERTAEQQRIYVDTGRSRTMNSKHLMRLAADLFFYQKNGDEYEWIKDKESLQALGDYWESLDPKNAWGGNWKSFQDTPHFERRL